MELTRESIQRKFRPTESYPSVEGTCIRDRLKLLSNVKNSTIIHSLPPDNYPVKDFRQCTNIPKEIDFLIIEDEHSKKEPILMRYYRCDDDILMAAYTLNENIWVVYTAIRLSINEDIVEEFFPGTLISESEREGITIVITELMSGFTTYLTHELKVINPEIIHSPRLKNMSRKDKHKHLIYRFNCDKDINNTPILDKLGQSDTMETTFTTSNKAALMSKIVKAAGLGNTDSAKDIFEIAMDLTPSILFLEVHPNPATLDDSKHYAFEHLPFPDCMFYCDMVVDNADGTEMIHKRGLLLRVKQMGDKAHLFIYRENNAKKYAFCASGEVQIGTNNFKLILPAVQTKLTAFNDELLNILLPVIKHSLWTITLFVPKLKNDPTKTFSVRKKVKEKDRALFLEYVLDLNKPTNYPKRKSLGGTHASPVEHLRRGHWRTARNGRRFFVEARIINEGKGGRIEKDYIV